LIKQELALFTWSRNNEKLNFESFGFHVKLDNSLWATSNMGRPHSGYDHGGEIIPNPGMLSGIEKNKLFNAFIVTRRAVAPIFTSDIILEEEILPDELTVQDVISTIGLGTQYDMFISFATQSEATIFSMSFSNGVDVGFSGL
jgi:hypothetical protein